MRLIVAVILLLSASAALIYYHCTKNGQSKEQIEQNQPSAAPIPAAVHQPQAKDETPNTYNAGNDCLYRLYLFATIAGVFVALGGIYAIWQQTQATAGSARATAIAARATQHSARASLKSVKLQEAVMQQWVDIENWKATLWIPEGGALSLNVQFDVVNPTNMLLTFESVFIQIGEHQSKIDRKNLIPPKGSKPVVTAIPITDEQFTKWEDLKELTFGIGGYVQFIDVLEKTRTQPFSGIIACSLKGGVRFIPPYGSGLYITGEEKKSGDPNK